MNSLKHNFNKYRYAWIASAALLSIFIADFIYYPSTVEPKSPSFNKGKNGLWLRYKWYFGEHSDNEVEAMINRLKENQIKYAYFHVRSTKHDGSLKYRYKENAIKLNAKMHALLPETKSIAWIYVESNFGRDGVDIAKKEIREKLIAQAKWLVEECNFDGIQWDYEFFPNKEPHFGKLLIETRDALGPNRHISVATPMWYPGTLWGWQNEYFTEIAQNCDQIAVMCYDSFFYYPRAYTWLVEQQAVNVTSAVGKANNNCKVILGIPVYDEGTIGHITHAENIRAALAGVRNGLANRDANLDTFEGVSPFAEYTMDENEWTQYRQLWLQK